MADTNNQHYVDQFSENVMHLAQLEHSLLLPVVYRKSGVVGEKFSQDQIGQWEMQKVVGKNQATPAGDPNKSRRWGNINLYNNAVPLDRKDKWQILADPMGTYTQAASMSIGRQIDQEIIAAATGDSLTGKDGGTTTALPSEQIISVNSSGMTFAKVRAALLLFNQNKVRGKKYMVVSPESMDALLVEDEVTNADYSSIQAIQAGGFDNKMWMGFHWIMHPELAKSGTTRTNFAFGEYGICAAMHEEPYIDIDIRKDLSHSKEIYYEANIGSTRLEESRVVSILTQES